MGHNMKDINIVHINIRGILTSQTELNLHINERQPHVITLNETFLKPHNKLKIPNYNIIRKDRRDRRNGGVAILYQKDLPVTEVELPGQFHKCEALAVKVRIPNWPLHISTIYNPPENPIPKDPINYLSKFHKSILLIDINAHHHSLGDHPALNNRQGLDLTNMLRRSNYANVPIPGPTRYPQTPRETFTSPEKILATKPITNRIKVITIHEPPNSDHAPVQITIHTLFWKPITQPTVRLTPDYDKGDWTLFRQLTEAPITDMDVEPTRILDVDKYDNTTPSRYHKYYTS